MRCLQGEGGEEEEGGGGGGHRGSILACSPTDSGSNPSSAKILLLSLWTVEISHPSSAYARDFVNAFSGRGLSEVLQKGSQIPLKVPNIEFDFHASVDSIQMLTDSSKSNLTLGTQLHAIIGTHFQLRH